MSYSGVVNFLGYAIILSNKGASFMIDTKIQWHPGFVAAIDLELKDYREDLIFEKEYNLNTKPLEIDLLIIKKEATVHIANDIGSFFKGHNILEYKSPEDHLDIDTFCKTLAYAYLYKSYDKYKTRKRNILAKEHLNIIVTSDTKEQLKQYEFEHHTSIGFLLTFFISFLPH